MNRSGFLQTAFMLGLIIGMVLPLQAAAPAVVVSLKSIEEILDDADFIGSNVGQEGLKEVAEQNIKALTGGAGLSGVDREKTLGLYWNLVESEPDNMGTVVVFLPISDEDEFKDLLKKLAPDLKDDDGQWSLTVQGLPLFAKFANDYCYISTAKEGLTDLSDPAKIANTEYDIAFDLNLSSIPQQAKDTYLGVAEQGARQGLQEQPEPENDAEAVGRKLGFDGMLGTIKSVVNDGDKLTFGLDVDSESRVIGLDLGLTGKPKTPLAHALAIYGKTTPTFAAVTSDDAPLQLIMTLPTTGLFKEYDELIEGMRKTADAEIDKDPKLEDDADRKAAKDVTNRLFNIAQATVKTGSLSAVIVFEQGDEDTVRVIGGAKVAKGDDAGKLLDDILKLSKESPDLAKIKPDVAKHAGARIHAITPDLNDKQTAMFGSDPSHLAIRTDSLWLSLGGGNLEALKKALDQSGKKAANSEPPISLRVKPATLVTLIEQDDQALIERAEALAGESGDVLNVKLAPKGTTGIDFHLDFGIDLINLFNADIQRAPAVQ